MTTKKDSSKNEKNVKYTDLFPKYSNLIAPALLPALLVLVSSVVFIFWYWGSPKNYNVGYKPEQPIPFSHRKHVSELGMDCRYCHNTVEQTAHAAIPPTETCMNCHKLIKPDSPHILKLRESMATGEPIDWVQIHRLPDYAYFDHSKHLNAGISCVSCHGRIDQMDVVKQVKPLSMSWCLECHRAPENHLRPKSQITNLGWEAENQKEIGLKIKEENQIYPGEDCNTCHR